MAQDATVSSGIPDTLLEALTLRGAREEAEYARLKASGDYDDDATMRLRAMIPTRGRDAVRETAWALRRYRDEFLARSLAARDGQPQTDTSFAVPTTPEMVERLGRLPGKTAKETYLSGILRAAERPLESQAFRQRRARYMAERWGMPLSAPPETGAGGPSSQAPWLTPAVAANAKNQMGASWGDVGSAAKDVLTSKRGWKNIGLGAPGALRDIAHSATFGLVDDGTYLSRSDGVAND